MSGVQTRSKTRGKVHKDGILERHSGTGRSGAPKRGGVGGKGSMGDPMIQEGPSGVNDKNDPNFEEEEI